MANYSQTWWLRTATVSYYLSHTCYGQDFGAALQLDALWIGLGLGELQTWLPVYSVRASSAGPWSGLPWASSHCVIMLTWLCPRLPVSFPRQTGEAELPFMTSFESHLASLPPSSQEHQRKGEVLRPQRRGKHGVERCGNVRNAVCHTQPCSPYPSAAVSGFEYDSEQSLGCNIVLQAR